MMVEIGQVLDESHQTHRKIAKSNSVDVQEEQKTQHQIAAELVLALSLPFTVCRVLTQTLLVM